MAYRNLTGVTAYNDAITDALLTGKEHIFCHLVKFERPVPQDISDASGFAYFTDGPYDISFDDRAVNVFGESFGPQKYTARTLKSVGTIKEGVEAKATATSITLNTANLGTQATARLLFVRNSETSATITSSKDFLDMGFSIGDRILINFSEAALTDGTQKKNNNQYVVLEGLASNNLVASVSVPLDSIIEDFTHNIEDSTADYTLSIANPELSAFVDATETTTFTNYINRDVTIYRAMLNPSTGAIIGQPFLIFKGIIAGGKLNEDPFKSSTMTWTLTSHWGDFVKVSGRKGVDSSHRNIEALKLLSTDALKASEYERDLGFMHADKSYNVAAPYMSKEARLRWHKKKKNFKKKKKSKTYYVDVQKFQDLELNLSSEYIPVVYGVQRVESTPVFADILKYPQKTYLCQAQVLCEGRISGILNAVIDDKSVLCIDEKDADQRFGGTTVGDFCLGRADKGDFIKAFSTYTDSVWPGTLGIVATGVNNSTSLTTTSDISGSVSVGATLSATGIDKQTMVVSISGTSITLSDPITAASGTRIRFRDFSNIGLYSVGYVSGGATLTTNPAVVAADGANLFGLDNINTSRQVIASSTNTTGFAYWGHHRAGSFREDITKHYMLHAGASDQDSNYVFDRVASAHRELSTGTMTFSSLSEVTKLKQGKTYQFASSINFRRAFKITAISYTYPFTVRFRDAKYIRQGEGGVNNYHTGSFAPVLEVPFQDTATLTTKQKVKDRQRLITKDVDFDITFSSLAKDDSDDFAGFMIQAAYYKDSLIDYWSPDHRLTDTAYVATIYTPPAAEDSLDNVENPEYIIKGKFIDCYNYDNSYTLGIDSTTLTNLENFKPGDKVTIVTGGATSEIDNIVAVTGYTSNGIKYLLLANKSIESGTEGVRVYTLNMTEKVRLQASFFIPYSVTDMWVTKDGVSLYVVDYVDPITTITSVNPGACRKYSRAGVFQGTINPLKHNPFFGEEHPYSSGGEDYRPSGVSGTSTSLYVYYPSAVAVKSNGQYPINNSRRLQERYVVKYDLTSLSTPDTALPSQVWSGSYYPTIPVACDTFEVEKNEVFNFIYQQETDYFSTQREGTSLSTGTYAGEFYSWVASPFFMRQLRNAGLPSNENPVRPDDYYGHLLNSQQTDAQYGLWHGNDTIYSNIFEAGNPGISHAKSNDINLIGFAPSTAAVALPINAVTTATDEIVTTLSMTETISSDVIFTSTNAQVEFGHSVAIDGNTMAVGVPSGQKVVIYTRSGTTWSVQETIQLSRDSFGYSVALDGDTLAIGTPFADLGTSSNRGIVRLYTRSGATWTQTLSEYGPSANAFYGRSVALKDNTFVVGADGLNKVYVWTKSGTAWSTNHVELSIPPDDSFIAFQRVGWSVAISGSNILVGAPYTDWGSPRSSTDNQGAILLYKLIENTWQYDAYMIVFAVGPREFGTAISISGSTVVVGAGGSSGLAHIFDLEGERVYSSGNTLVSFPGRQEVTVAGLNSTDRFGDSVAISGDTILIGAPADDDNGTSSGSVWVFTKNSSGVWSQYDKFSGNAAYDEFGYSVALDGDTAAIGAVGDDDAFGISSGSVTVLQSSTRWNLGIPKVGDYVFPYHTSYYANNQTKFVPKSTNLTDSTELRITAISGQTITLSGKLATLSISQVLYERADRHDLVGYANNVKDIYYHDDKLYMLSEPESIYSGNYTFQADSQTASSTLPKVKVYDLVEKRFDRSKEIVLNLHSPLYSYYYAHCWGIAVDDNNLYVGHSYAAHSNDSGSNAVRKLFDGIVVSGLYTDLQSGGIAGDYVGKFSLTTKAYAGRLLNDFDEDYVKWPSNYTGYGRVSLGAENYPNNTESSTNGNAPSFLETRFVGLDFLPNTTQYNSDPVFVTFSRHIGDKVYNVTDITAPDYATYTDTRSQFVTNTPASYHKFNRPPGNYFGGSFSIVPGTGTTFDFYQTNHMPAHEVGRGYLLNDDDPSEIYTKAVNFVGSDATEIADLEAVLPFERYGIKKYSVTTNNNNTSIPEASPQTLDGLFWGNQGGVPLQSPRPYILPTTDEPRFYSRFNADTTHPGTAIPTLIIQDPTRTVAAGDGLWYYDGSDRHWIQVNHVEPKQTALMTSVNYLPGVGARGTFTATRNAGNATNTQTIVNDLAAPAWPTPPFFAVLKSSSDNAQQEVIQVTAINSSTNAFTWTNSNNTTQYELQGGVVEIPKELVKFTHLSTTTLPLWSPTDGPDKAIKLASPTGDGTAPDYAEYSTTFLGESKPAYPLALNAFVADDTTTSYAVFDTPLILADTGDYSASVGAMGSLTLSASITFPALKGAFFAADKNAIYITTFDPNATDGEYAGGETKSQMGENKFSSASSSRLRGVHLDQYLPSYYATGGEIYSYQHKRATQRATVSADGNTTSATIKDIQTFIDLDDIVKKRISFTGPVPSEGSEFFTIKTSDEQSPIIAESGSFYPSKDTAVLVDPAYTKGPIGLGSIAHKETDKSISSEAARILGIPEEVRTSTSLDLVYTTFDYQVVNSRAYTTGWEEHEPSPNIATWDSTFALKTETDLQPEESYVYIKETGAADASGTRVLCVPALETLNIENWKGSDAFLAKTIAAPLTIYPADWEWSSGTSEWFANVDDAYANLLGYHINNATSSQPGRVSFVDPSGNSRTDFVFQRANSTLPRMWLRGATGTEKLGWLGNSARPAVPITLTFSNPAYLVVGSSASAFAQKNIVATSTELYFKDLVRLNTLQVPNAESTERIAFRTGNFLFDAQISAYSQEHQYAILNSHVLNFPAGTQYRIYREEEKDLRVSNNPALQLLDYLLNPVYGKGLDIEKDIDLDSFKRAATLCDAKSNVTLVIKAKIGSLYQAKPVIGEVFTINYNNYFANVLQDLPQKSNLFTGTVANVYSRFYRNEEYYEVIFNSVLGKIGTKWASDKVVSKEYVWKNGGSFWGPMADNSEIAIDKLGPVLSQVGYPGGTLGGHALPLDAIKIQCTQAVEGGTYWVGRTAIVDIGKDGTIAACAKEDHLDKPGSTFTMSNFPVSENRYSLNVIPSYNTVSSGYIWEQNYLDALDGNIQWDKDEEALVLFQTQEPADNSLGMSFPAFKTVAGRTYSVKFKAKIKTMPGQTPNISNGEGIYARMYHSEIELPEGDKYVGHFPGAEDVEMYLPSGTSNYYSTSAIDGYPSNLWPGATVNSPEDGRLTVDAPIYVQFELRFVAFSNKPVTGLSILNWSQNGSSEGVLIKDYEVTDLTEGEDIYHYLDSVLSSGEEIDIEEGYYFYTNRKTSTESEQHYEVTAVAVEKYHKELSFKSRFSNGETFYGGEQLAITSPITDRGRVATDGNPIVKSWDERSGTFTGNGYSLYDADNITYWRYLGWDSLEQNKVTRHQTNQVIDTSNTVFDNVNLMLQQFNGLLRFAGGKYYLDVETAQGPLETISTNEGTKTPAIITEDNIIGKIDITDKGVKSSFSAMSAKVSDPMTLYKSREINFFNSDYLKEDNYVVKEGDWSSPGVTNYFNARINVKQELDASRFSLDIQFTLGPEGILHRPGDIVVITYDRFRWEQKPFRIMSAAFNYDGKVTIIAKEHSDKIFTLLADGNTTSLSELSIDVPIINDPAV